MVQMSGSSNPNGQDGGGDGRKPYRGSRPDLQEKIRQKYLRRVGSGASSSSSGQNGSPALSQNGGASNARRRSQDHRPGGVSYSSTPEMAFNDPDGNGNFMFFEGSQSNQSPPCLGATGGQGHDKEDSALNTVLREIQNNKTKKTTVLVGEEGTIYQNNFDDDDETVETIPVVAKQRLNYRAPVVARQQTDFTLPVVARQQPIYHRTHHRAHRHHERVPVHQDADDGDDGDDEATESDDTLTCRRSQGLGQDIDPLQRIINACHDEVNAPIDDRIYEMRPILPARGFGRFELPIRMEIGDGAFGMNQGGNFMGEPRQGEGNGIFDRNADNSLDETLQRMRNDGHNAETRRRNELLAQQLNENESGLRRENNVSPLNDPIGLLRDEIPQDGGNNDVEDDIEPPRERIEGPHTKFVDELLAGIDDDDNMQPDDNLILLTLREFGETAEDGERSVNHMMNDFREADRLRELEGDEMRAGALGSGFGMGSFPPSGEHLLGLGGYNPPKPSDNVNRKAKSDDQGVDQPKDDCHVAGEVEPERRDVDHVGPSLTPATIKGPNHKQDNGRASASTADIVLNSVSSTNRNLHASARNDTTKHVSIDQSSLNERISPSHTGTRSDPYGTDGLRDRHRETDQLPTSRTDSSTGQMDSRLFQTDPTDFGRLPTDTAQEDFGNQAAGHGQINIGHHSTRPGQTDLWGQSFGAVHSDFQSSTGLNQIGQSTTGSGQNGFGQSSTGSGQIGFGQYTTGFGQIGFGQSTTGPGQIGFGPSTTGPGQIGFGQSTTGFGQIGFGQSTTGPGQIGFGQSTTGPGQNGFGQSTTGFGQIGFGQSTTGFGLTGFDQSTTGPQYSTDASQNEYGHMPTGIGQPGGQNVYGAENESIPNPEKPDLRVMLSQMCDYEAFKAATNSSPRATDALHTIIILDTSSAMDGEPFIEAGRFISQFLSDLEELQFEYNQQENVALVCMGFSTEVVQHFTNNYTLIRNATDTLITGGANQLLLAGALLSVLLSHSSTDKRPGVGGVYNLGSHIVQPRVIFITNGRMNSGQSNADLMTLCTDSIQTATQSTLVTAYCVPVGKNCNMPFLELLSESTGGRVVFPAEVKYLSRAILHHEIVAKLKGNNTREPTRSAIIEILKQVTGVADVEDVNSILEVYRRGEPDMIERERLEANLQQQLQPGSNFRSFGEERQGVVVNDPTQAFNVPSNRHSSLRQNRVEGQTFDGPSLNGQAQPFLFQDASQEGLSTRGPGFNGQLGPPSVQGASQKGLSTRGPSFNGQLGPPSVPGASQEGLNISGRILNGQSGSSVVNNGFEGANQGAQGGPTHKPIVARRKMESIGKISTFESSQDDNTESGKFSGEIQQMFGSNSSNGIENGVSLNNDEEMDIDPYNLNERKGENENDSSSIELPEEMEGLFKDGGNRTIGDICGNGMLGGLAGLFSSNVNNKSTENGVGSQMNDSRSQNSQLNAQRSSLQSPLRPAGSTTGSQALLVGEQKSRPEALQKEVARRQENQQDGRRGNLQASRGDNLYEGLRSNQSMTAGGNLQGNRGGSLLERGGNFQTHTGGDQLARKGGNQQSLSQQMSAMNIHGQHGANSRRMPIDSQSVVGNPSQNISTGSQNSQSKRTLHNRENVSQNTVHQPASVGQGSVFRRVNPSPQNEVFGTGNVRGGGQNIGMPNNSSQRVEAEGSILSPDRGRRLSLRIPPQGHSEVARQNQRSTQGSSTHMRPAGKNNPKNSRGFP